MSINIKCDTQNEASFIGEAINVYFGETDGVPELEHGNTKIYVGDDEYTGWIDDEEDDDDWLDSYDER